MIEQLKEYLFNKYNCSLIILYGSYARGEETIESDLDVICFGTNLKSSNDTSIFNNVNLDVWLYELSDLNDANYEDFLQLLDGVVIYDPLKIGEVFLKELRLFYLQGPQSLTNEETMFYKNWLVKTYRRTLKNDLEARYRLHWLLFDCLEIYCKLRNIYFLGPKKTLNQLKTKDKIFYQLYDDALSKNATNESIEKLIDYICE